MLAYKAKHRAVGTEAWQDVGTAIESEMTLVGQERGIPLGFRVVALNKLGKGQSSNTVAVTL